ncbi:Fc.00g084540.m01.CDS01 [Cosmosporella sp. VM-42]
MGDSKPTPPKHWILNAFSMSTPGHLAAGLWRHPRNRTSHYMDVDYWTDLPKILEAGKFHGLFIADVLSHYGVYKGAGNIDPGLPGAAQFPITNPALVVAAMGAVTKHLSFGVTASTTYENPFLLARRFATLDHLTKGRIAWNAVTSYLEAAARNLGLPTQIAHDERYAIADEFLTFTNSGRARGGTPRWCGITELRLIPFLGEKYFNSLGPLPTEPSIQRTPFIFQAGASKAGRSFATKHAECMFLPGMEPESVKRSVDDIRKQALEQGRDPSTIKLIAGILMIVDETDEKAQAKYEEYLSYADLEGSLTLFGGWTGFDLDQWGEDEDFKFSGPGAIQSMISSWSATIPGTDGVKWTKKRIAQELSVGGPHARAIGSPKTVADILQKWIDEAGIDGFNISYAINPGDFEDIIK